MEFLGILTGMLSVAGFFAWMLALSPVGKAYAEKIRVARGRGQAPKSWSKSSRLWRMFAGRWRNCRSV